MEHLKQGHIKYGLVTDEFGSIEGIVTLQDILKALIGDLPELGEEPDIGKMELISWTANVLSMISWPISIWNVFMQTITTTR